VKRLALLLALLALGACAEKTTAPGTASSSTTAPVATTPAETKARTAESVRVAWVADGDTIELADGRRVRLVQIDAPEGGEGECYADEATRVLRRLLPQGTEVRLEADPRLDSVDTYGRLLRYVFRNRTNVNVTLVKQGAATVWFFRGDRGRYASGLLRAARRARAGDRGLWGACPGTPFDPLGPATTGTGEPPAEAAGECAGAISWRDAGAHAGEQATVKGPVAGTHYAADSNGQPTFLNVGLDYPDPGRFTVLIWGNDRGRFPKPPENTYAGKTICAAGRIQEYRGVPEMEVSSPAQIAVVG